MGKRFRLVMDLEAEIKETLKYTAPGKPWWLKQLLQTLLNDEGAILDLYKLWLLADLHTGDHIDAAELAIGKRDEIDMFCSLAEKLPTDARKYFKEMTGNDQYWETDDLMPLVEQFSLLKFINASFEEVK